MADAVERDDPGLDMVFFHLRAIEDMLFSKIRMTEQTLSLPLAAERERQRALCKAQADAREDEQQSKLRDAEAATRCTV